MEPTDLTIRVLQEIRDSVREVRDTMDRRFEAMDKRFETMDKRFEQMDKRFLAIETTLSELAQQMVMLSRGIKTALENRSSNESRMDDLEKRIVELEKRNGR